jgi:hypothetical protein
MREQPARAAAQPLRLWLWALALASPMLAIYVLHFFWPSAAGAATGFLQYDQPYYMANAREHFDAGRFALLFNLPFSPFEHSPRVYLQPMSLLLGVVAHLSSWPPGFIYAGFGVLAGVAFMRVALALYAEVVGLAGRAERVSLVLFVWGGGLLVVAGLAQALATGARFDTVEATQAELLTYDPFWGYWFLNLGRNLYYSTEALYHLLALGAVLLLLRQRWVWALVVLLLLSASQPFTGLQFGLILLVWSALEQFVDRSNARRVPLALVAGVGLIVAAHLVYYLLFLGRFPEQQQLQRQWIEDTATWVLAPASMVLAYGPVALLVAWRVRSGARLRAVFAERTNRLLACWFLVSLALANNDLFMRPHQPLHFTRGYIWTALFLLGAPALVSLLRRAAQLAWRGAVLCVVVVAGLLVDNATWFGLQGLQAIAHGTPPGLHLSPERQQVLALMNRPQHARALVLSSDHWIGYLATVYSPLRSWASHAHNTPGYAQRMQELRRFFEQGALQPAWQDRPLVAVVIANHERAWQKNLRRAGLRLVLRNAQYSVYARARGG